MYFCLDLKLKQPFFLCRKFPDSLYFNPKSGCSHFLPITTKVVYSNPIYGEVYSIQHYVIKFVSDLRQVSAFPLGTPVSFTNKTDLHDIAV